MTDIDFFGVPLTRAPADLPPGPPDERPDGLTDPDGPQDTATSSRTARGRQGPAGSRPRGRFTADNRGPRRVPSAVPYTRGRRGELADRARDGLLTRVRRGVYLEPADVDVRDREQFLLAQVRGVVDTTTAPYWVSHDTAALLWGCWTRHLPPFVHVTQLVNPRVERERQPALRRHWTDLPERDRARVGDVPVTSLERTVVDCARSLPLERSLVVVDSALRRGADRRVVDEILLESAGKRGVVRARRALELADSRSESPGETLVRLAATLGGLPTPEPQIEVATSRGVYVLDLAWADLRIAIEFDGAVKYSGGAYGDPEQARYAALARERALVAAGWRVVRLRWDDLDDPVEVGRRLAQARLEVWAQRRNAR